MNLNNHFKSTIVTTPTDTDLPDSTPPIPDEITAEYSDCYRICFKTDTAGIATLDPSIDYYILKPAFAARYPHIVSAWETLKREQQEESERIHRNLTGYAYYFRSPYNASELKDKDPGVACDQNLLPGMTQHWGETRMCETHWREHPGFLVCKGCRVAHHMQRDRGFDRQKIIAKGARVPVCETCAGRAVADFGVGHRGCVCDSRWTCFRCREDELRKLTKARKDKGIEGRCGKCGGEDGLVSFVDYCLYCRKMRVYAGSSGDCR